MIDEAEESASGVVCLRCGTRTPLPVSKTGNLPGGVNDPLRFPLHIVRCDGCGKEGSYLAGEVIRLKTEPHSMRTAA